MTYKINKTTYSPTTVKARLPLKRGISAVPRIWLILAIFVGVLGLIGWGLVSLARNNSADAHIANLASQFLSNGASDKLRASTLAPEDSLVAGQLTVLGLVQANTFTANSDMFIGSRDQALTLQGNDVAISTTAGGITNSLHFAAPSGTSKAITVPNATGTVAVSASGPLLLDTNGNLSCPSCGGSSTSTANISNSYSTTELVTNNYVTNVNNTLSLTAGNGIAISGTDGEYTIDSTVDGVNRSLSNLSSVAINTDLTPGTNNSIDLGSQATAFRNGYFGTSVQTPSLDTAATGSLSIGATRASDIQLGANTTLATGKKLTVNGEALFKNATNSSSAFKIQDTAGATLLNADTSQGMLSVGAYTPTTIWTAGSVTQTNYPTSTAPMSITTVDFNSDGKFDLVTANANASTVSVLLNNGNGTFATKVDYVTGSSPYDVASADFNGDGKMDIVTANRSASTVSVLLNNGNGTFTTKVDYVTGSILQSVSTADFNNDGKMDIVTASSLSSTVSVLLNNGNGTFATKVDYVTGSSPYDVASADFNGDGKMDIVTANHNANTASVLINNGNGTFATKVDYATGGQPFSITATDLNADSKSDFAVVNYASNTLSVFLNNGNGTFATKVDYATGGQPSDVIATDLNADSKSDLVVSSWNVASVSVFYNNGNGSFAPKVDYVLAGAKSYASAAADFDGNGLTDIATANYIYNNMSVLLLTASVGTPVVQDGSRLMVNASSNTVGQIIQGTSGQTADLLQVRDNINAMLFTVSSTGNVVAAGSLNVAGTFTGTGNSLFKTSINSTTAFQVQQANGTAIFSIDTSAGRVGIGTVSPFNKLSVNTLTTASGGNSSAQFALSTGAAFNKGVVLQGVTGQASDLLQAQSSTGAVLASISATGTLTVTTAVVNGNITINGHVITGGTVPVITANVAACMTPTVAVAGNDTSGTVTVTTGTSCTVAGSLATVMFNTPFSATPRIIMTASNASAADLKLYSGSATTTAFTVDTATVPTSGTTYIFNYWAVQ